VECGAHKLPSLLLSSGDCSSARRDGKSVGISDMWRPFSMLYNKRHAIDGLNTQIPSKSGRIYLHMTLAAARRSELCGCWSIASADAWMYCSACTGTCWRLSAACSKRAR
jgi:hypothetical protein